MSQQPVLLLGSGSRQPAVTRAGRTGSLVQGGYTFFSDRHAGRLPSRTPPARPKILAASSDDIERESRGAGRLEQPERKLLPPRRCRSAQPSVIGGAPTLVDQRVRRPSNAWNEP